MAIRKLIKFLEMSFSIFTALFHQVMMMTLLLFLWLEEFGTLRLTLWDQATPKAGLVE
jgi:hypothetical protein